jgi:hypothetical protein
MPTLDGEHHEVHFQLAVMGALSERFVADLGLADRQLILKDVRGFAPRMTFQTFPNDPWEGDGSAAIRLKALVPELDGLILTDAFAEGTHYSSTALERLRAALFPGKIAVPTAVFGGPAMVEEWKSLSGVAPVHASEPTKENAMLTVKALAKSLLRAKVRSDPPASRA